MCINNKSKLSKIQKPKMKELWDNREDEAWEKSSELRPEHKEKLAKIIKGKYISRKEFEGKVKK